MTPAELYLAHAGIIPLGCGCIYYQYGPSIRCSAHPGRDDCEHDWDMTTTRVWPGESTARLTMTCRTCGEVRGRCKP